MPKQKQGKQTKASEDTQLRDRILELRRMRANELLDNEGNLYLHPQAQRDALAGILGVVGIAQALVAYYSERNEGALTLIDGHARKEDYGEVAWPVLILDVDDYEADLLLASLDPMKALATLDARKVENHLRHTNTDDEHLQRFFSDLAAKAGVVPADEGEEEEEPPTEDKEGDMQQVECPHCGHHWNVKLSLKQGKAKG